MSRTSRPPCRAKVALYAKGVTITDAAPQVGVSKGTLTQVLNHNVAPWPALNRRLSEYLGMPEPELWLDA